MQSANAFVNTRMSAVSDPAQLKVKMSSTEYSVQGRPIGGPLEPVSNFVLVKIKDALSSTSGGIILPDQAKEKPTEGVVISAGPGKYHPDTGIKIPMPVKPGDNVIYGKFDGSEVEYNNEDHTLIRDDDILVVYSGEDVTLDNLRLVRDQVLVLLERTEEKTSSGIVIAPTASVNAARPTQGKVIALGEGRMANSGELIPNGVSVGDMIKYRQYGGSELKIGDDNYLVIRASEVLAKWQA